MLTVRLWRDGKHFETEHTWDAYILSFSRVHVHRNREDKCSSLSPRPAKETQKETCFNNFYLKKEKHVLSSPGAATWFVTVTDLCTLIHETNKEWLSASLAALSGGCLCTVFHRERSCFGFFFHTHALETIHGNNVQEVLDTIKRRQVFVILFSLLPPSSQVCL